MRYILLILLAAALLGCQTPEPGPAYPELLDRSVILAIPELQSCQVASDCNRVVRGVCDPKDTCEEGSVGCDSECRGAINKKYLFLYHLEYFEDECLQGSCAHGELACVQNTCRIF